MNKVVQKSQSVRLMGTIIDLFIEHVSPDRIIDDVIQQLREYEYRFSANDSKSELMTINKNAGIQPIKVHPQLFELIKIGTYHSCEPNSNLNIAIGPLVQSWRIGFDDAKVPSADEIDVLLQLTNPKNIILNEEHQSVYLKERGMSIDLGALAKGYIADLIITYLKKVGVTTALINLGGNVVALGPSQESEKKYWNIGIQNPMQPRKHHVAMLKVKNESVVTSGVYERTLENKGKKYHHILDPLTGYPTTTDVASLTIRSDQSLDGEIWTTRLYGKSSEEIIHTLNQLEGIEGFVITKEENVLYSNHMFSEKMEGSK